MKRVLIFSLAYYPHVGGAEVALKEITDRISDIEFTMITLRIKGEPQSERIGNVLVRRVGGGASYLEKIAFVPRAALLAARLHRERPFDAFWAMMSYMLFPIALLRIAGIRVPYLLTLQEGDPFEHVFGRLRILPFRPLLSYGFRHASAVQAISSYLARWASEAGYRGAAEVIPNGVDVERFSHDCPREELALSLGKREGEIYLITTSRLVRKNAVDDVIRALARMPENSTFLVLGTGPDEGMLRALAAELRVESRVRFLGFVPHEALLAYLKISDIFIRPSRSEGMGNSFIEAMAAGLPVVATQEGGIADFLTDSVRNPDKPPTGWAVDKDSPEQIAEAVAHILANPEETKRTTAYARVFVSERYDWNLVASEMKEVFNTVTNAKP